MLLGLYVLYKEEDTTVQSIQNHCKLSSLGRETEFLSSQSPLYYIGCSHMIQLLREHYWDSTKQLTGSDTRNNWLPQ